MHIRMYICKYVCILLSIMFILSYVLSMACKTLISYIADVRGPLESKPLHEFDET